MAQTSPQPVAGNGLLDRRTLLGSGIMLAGRHERPVSAARSPVAAAEPVENGPLGASRPACRSRPYGQPSKFEQKVVRTLSNPKLEPRGPARRRTPHHSASTATITPNGLHFVIATRRRDLMSIRTSIAW